MSTHNIGFYEDFTKSIFHLSSNAQLVNRDRLHNLTGALPEGINAEL